MMFGPWRWRDVHTQRAAYYDGTPVAGPFNSELMEDVLMMRAFGIPCSVYWIDRPWGPGELGYDDFEIDAKRLPHFAESVRWLGFSCFNPIMEVGPTRNTGFWDLSREPRYDSRAIAGWRLYARLHQRLAEYGHRCALARGVKEWFQARKGN